MDQLIQLGIDIDIDMKPFGWSPLHFKLLQPLDDVGVTEARQCTHQVATIRG